ncbi:hypothetical protein NCPPB3923_22100 [Burkholderia glumae]|nr:hypothetical protein NCPPB3923_22100 [Burkholderia glumae]
MGASGQFANFCPSGILGAITHLRAPVVRDRSENLGTGKDGFELSLLNLIQTDTGRGSSVFLRS